MTDTIIKPNKTMLDTNIYGWALDYISEEDVGIIATASYNLIIKLLEEKEKLEPSYLALSCQQIIDEIITHKDPGLQTLHDTLCSEIIYRSKYIEALSENYFSEFRSRKLHITIGDCEIVSSATIGACSFLVTENKKTLSNPRAIDIYREINEKYGFSTPQIITSLEALIRMFSFPTENLLTL